MRKTFKTLLVALLVVAMLPVLPVSIFADTTPATFSDHVAAGNITKVDTTYTLNDDITITATDTTKFTGTILGEGHTITTSVPIFAELGATTIGVKGDAAHKLTINGTITNDVDQYVGAIAKKNTGTVNIFYVTSNVDITVSNTENTTTKDQRAVGGFIGYLGASADIRNSVNNGDITQTETVLNGNRTSVGGIVGQTGASLNLYYNANTGNITSNGVAGGLVGRVTNQIGAFDKNVNAGDIYVRYSDAKIDRYRYCGAGGLMGLVGTTSKFRCGASTNLGKVTAEALAAQDSGSVYPRAAGLFNGYNMVNDLGTDFQIGGSIGNFSLGEVSVKLHADDTDYAHASKFAGQIYSDQYRAADKSWETKGFSWITHVCYVPAGTVDNAFVIGNYAFVDGEEAAIDAAEAANFVEFDFSMVDGGSIRYGNEEMTGIRFKSNLNTANLKDLKTSLEATGMQTMLEFGTILTTEAQLGTNELTVELGADNYVDARREGKGDTFASAEKTATHNVILGSIVNVPVANNETAIYARSYIKLGDAYFYTSNTAERTVKAIAQAAISAGEAAGDADKLALLNTYAGNAQ